MSATIREIVDDALTIVGEVSGAGVQAYSDDRMFADCIRAFDLLFKKYRWDQFIAWTTLTLDGVTGKITTNDFTHVKDFEDMLAVHIAGESYPLPTLPLRVNPNTIKGNKPRYWASLPATAADYLTKRFVVYPITAIGNVDVSTSVYPIANGSDWDWTDVMQLDKAMLSHGVAFMTLSADETNAGAADAQRLLMEDKFATVKGLLSDRPIAIGSNGPRIPSEWFVSN